MNDRAGALALLFDKDLATLRTELEGYPDDASVWKVQPGINNSAGTLVLHLTGNLKHFVGASLGKTGYVRDRDAEFGDRDLPRRALLQRIDETRDVVAKTLGGLDDAALDRPFPGKGPQTLGDAPTSGALLTYMYGHFAYHLGQVNYHRRLLADGGR
jgi:hypothetical protein